MFLKRNILPFVIMAVIFSILSICVSESDYLNEGPHHRSRRQLLFPNSTLLQFNAGIGTPSPAKNINFNWAFQANFQLPWNRSQIPVDILHANGGYDGDSRKKRELNNYYPEEARYSSGAKLYHFYKYIEDVLTGFGHNGTSCVLRALCQLGAEPLHPRSDEDLLHEVASFVLNPSNDISGKIRRTDEAYPYIEAHNHGKKARDCLALYKDCTISLLDMFSELQDVS